MAEDTELDLRRRAEQRADAKIGFRKHFIAYVLVNGAFIAINLLTSRDYLWFIWPLLGWGIGVVAHFAAVYIDDGAARERAVMAEMERMRERER
ncbi:2TM domain-containing protein [Phenylobacterium sp.]|uniref:2TM domain-containing protein n=1 Tax=Phenylobacterium sp. TaxID=1871053 RepID=UPI002F93FDC3